MEQTNPTATATLCSGKSVELSRAELATLKTPPRTLTYTPVAFSLLVDLIETRLDERGMSIRKAKFAVQHDGMKLFSVLVLQHQTRNDFSFALGLRASNDKSLPIELVAGGNVFVCDNMMLSGDAEILCRKHTGGLDIRSEISSGVDRAVAKFNVLDGRIAQLKAANLGDTEAKALIFDAAYTGVMPWRLADDVYKTYAEPPYPEFEPRTMWSLNNSFTEVFKGLRANIALEATQKLGSLFQM